MAGGETPGPEPLVPLGVRVPESIKRRLKVHAVISNQQEQAIVARVLDQALPPLPT
jgi:hypothetical protein